MSEPSQRLNGVQATRGLAALMVVMCHSQAMFEKYHNRGLTTPSWFSNPLIAVFGTAGVDVFFVISGFIITHVAWNHFGRESFNREFLAKRLIRIVPMYWICTTVMAVAFFVFPTLIRSGRQSSLGHVICSYLFLPWKQGDDTTPLLTVGWSLNYEMLFYLVFALCLPFARPRALLSMVVGLLIVFGLANILTAMALSSHFWFFADSMILEFLFGIGLAVSFRAGYLKKGWGILFFGLGWVALIAMVAQFGSDLHEWRGLAWGVPSAFIVAGAISWSHLGRVPKTLVVLGDISYSLYLVHFFCQVAIGRSWIAVNPNVPSELLLVLLVLIPCGVAYLANRWIERPSNDWLLRLKRN
jgi:peptidoglycan/LPS O-acetylase OafA/YrhL